MAFLMFFSITPGALAQDDTEIGAFYGAMFFSPDFGSISSSSHYGLLLDCYNIGSSHIGFTCVPGSFNFGFADSPFTSDLMMLGPNVSYQVGKNVMLALPVCAMCYWFSDDDYKEIMGKSTTWGWMINPKVHFKINKVSLQLGFVLDGGFEGGKVNAGFNAAIGI